jgi:hypothetical protein
MSRAVRTNTVTATGSTTDTARGLPVWAVLLGCGMALALGLVNGSDAAAQTAPKAESSAAASASAAADLSPDPTPATAGSAAASSGASASNAHDRADHGLDPMYGGGMVPLKWMPPGTNASPVPSEEIFPPQTVTIRFNHKLHIKQFKQTCKVCHAAAYKSGKAADRLLPEPAKTCDNCHDVDHSNLNKVQGGEEPDGACTYCHLGENAGKDGRVAKMIIPKPNLRNNHKLHLDRNIQCSQCHGMIEELELATRENLPRMAGCFNCHAMSGAAQGEAKGACTTCHVSKPNGIMKTSFSTGELQPPMWLHGAAHTPDWIMRHKVVAGSNSEMCASCHAPNHCSDCHDGKLRPRAIHPNDFISMHPQAARQDNPRCVSCHSLQNFCADCHRRVGVSRDVASANRLAGRRFHPAPQVWTTGPRSTQHHAWEAQRNLHACVSCHSERDCATCHATKGVRGGGGVNPHPIGFSSKCSHALKANPRPCLVCHTPSDPLLEVCR